MKYLPTIIMAATTVLFITPSFADGDNSVNMNRGSNSTTTTTTDGSNSANMNKGNNSTTTTTPNESNSATMNNDTSNSTTTTERTTTDTKTYSDTGITTNVKNSFLAEKVFGEGDISAMTIHVETVDGIVTLSGTADNQTQINNAITLAKQIEGVKEVKSTVEIKP